MPDWLAERGGFELTVPQVLSNVEFSAKSAHYSAGTKAPVLERICSPGVRLSLLSLRLGSFAKLMRGIR
jgi:hypothetical protein